MIHLESYTSGHWQTDVTGYRFFMPSPVHDEWGWDNPQINLLLEKAAVRLGELNSSARLVPNSSLFIQLHVTKEAVLSSRIEGTQTNIDEALLSSIDIDPERRDDWKEVNNYIQALFFAIEQLKTLPLSSRLLKQTHQILLDNARGKHKLPGEFRRSQNWIGGATLADAVFVPPHSQYVESLMADLEHFLHNDQIHVPALIRIGIAHYQFETIHPFLDGNGRIGRLMIPLFLVEQGILSQPLLYLSTYFEQNKGLYYDNLTFVRSKNDMTQWLKYFLVGLEQTAKQAVDTLSGVLQLKDEFEQKVYKSFGRRTVPGLHLLQHLFQHPIISVQEAATVTSLSYKAANDLIGEFVKQGMLKEMTGLTRNRLFVMDEYIDKYRRDT